MIDGAMLIGGEARQADAHFVAKNPATGEALDPNFSCSGSVAVSEACTLAATCARAYAHTDLTGRAALLERIGEEILAIGDALIERAMAETGLPRVRLEGERGRTVGQLQHFAEVVRQGDWLDATIDHPLPDRQPLPRPDLRRMNVPLGPVAVFGASNFPLAFSVAGGDTAAALAAGCPVVVKGHPAHPGTGEYIARAVAAAVRACGLPAGVFAYLPGDTYSLGAALVANDRIKAVGFTGSRRGGLALMQIAAARSVPIPVYTEMSSINPVVLMPTALNARGPEIATGFIQSLIAGGGQFCTNPGLVLGIAGPALDAFVDASARALAESASATMLSAGILTDFEQGVAALAEHSAVTRVARGRTGDGPHQAAAALFRTDAQRFLLDPALGHEVFGSSSIVVACRDLAELMKVIASLEGQLTMTLQLDPADEADAQSLISEMTDRAGRVLANGWPTGVEVSHAMVHGGPFPATGDGRSTSVGSAAILRFLRPVCFQNLPNALLPFPLADANPWSIARRIDGRRDGSRR